MADADTYTFGDNDLAAERLRILARAFEPTSRAFLADVWARAFQSGQRPDHAVDLGCGPGYTTRLIREVMSPTLTTGLDRSTRFLARAQLWQTADLRFVAHDVSAGPFPVAGADIFYARFLLTHLAAPGAVLSTWAQAATPGAHLLLEETARLASSQPALAQYYTLVAALQRAHGQNMTIGQTLDRLAEGTGWEVQRSRLTTARLPARLMARIHVMNLRTWKNDRLAAGLCDPATLEQLDGALERLACGREAAEPVDCELKQLWLRRAMTMTAAPSGQPRPADAVESAAPPGD
jgi:SAM-dependent methyltransferase